MAFFEDTDGQLITALKQSDRDVYAHIYQAYYNKLCRYVYSLSDDGRQAEDIVQDTLLHIWQKRETLVIHTSLNAYLYRATRNSFIDRCRKEDRKKSLMDDLRMEAIIEMESSEIDIKNIRLTALQKIIDQLPAKRKEIFILNKFKNYKYKEIAAMRNISERTVESQIRKALITIREEVARLRLNDVLPFFVGFLFC